MATYADLKTQLQAFAENNSAELQTSLDQICANAQMLCYRDLKVLGHETEASAALVIGTRYIDIPADLLSLNFLAVILATGAYQELISRDESFLRVYWPNPTTQGTPKYFAGSIVDPVATATRRWTIAPTPDAALTRVINYRKMPATLASGADTNWLFTYAFDLVLYQGMIAVAGFVIDDRKGGLVETYQGLYARALAQVVESDDFARQAASDRVPTPPAQQ